MDEKWKWWVDHNSNNLYSHNHDDTWNLWTPDNNDPALVRYHHQQPQNTPMPLPPTLTRVHARHTPNSPRARILSRDTTTNTPTNHTPTTTSQHLASFHKDSHWAVSNIIQLDNGETIATSIRNKTAIAVSDGSLKLGFGTAAYVIEGEDSTNRILGTNVVPGPIDEGDSHRCEVAGIYAVALIVKALAKQHNITTGSITMACDNQQALQLFDTEYLPDPSHKNFDIVHATWSLLQTTPIHWIGDHVKGHQDQHKHRRLTRTEKLNVEMDALAKGFWRHKCVHNNGFIPHPPNIPIFGEGWQLWQGDSKVAHPNSHALYHINIQDPITQQWWVRNGHIPATTVATIDWDSTGTSIKKLPLPRRRWITKTASSNCGIGETLVTWKHQTDSTCPRCTQSEDTTHVYRCTGHNASDLWNESIDTLRTSLTKLRTSPKIQEALIDCLSKWRRNDPIIITDYPPGLRQLITEQQTIGWQQLLEGLPHKLWKKLQHRYYKYHNIRKSSNKWINEVMKQIHNLAWTQWNHRNHIKHNVSKPHQTAANTRLNRAIRKEYLTGTRHLMPGDKTHLRINLLTLLTRPLAYRKAWLIAVTHARQRGQRLDTGQEEEHQFSHEISSLFQWMKGRPLRPSTDTE